MVIYNLKMDISVTDFKARCLDLIRKVEAHSESVTIRRRGRIVARLEPANGSSSDGKPWERLRALGGSASLAAKEPTWSEEDFEGLALKAYLAVAREAQGFPFRFSTSSTIRQAISIDFRTVSRLPTYPPNASSARRRKRTERMSLCRARDSMSSRS